MIYDVRQTTTLCVPDRRYPGAPRAATAAGGRPRQQVAAAMLDIDPVPASRRETIDLSDVATTCCIYCDVAPDAS